VDRRRRIRPPRVGPDGGGAIGISSDAIQAAVRQMNLDLEAEVRSGLNAILGAYNAFGRQAAAEAAYAVSGTAADLAALMGRTCRRRPPPRR